MSLEHVILDMTLMSHDMTAALLVCRVMTSIASPTKTVPHLHSLSDYKRPFENPQQEDLLDHLQNVGAGRGGTERGGGWQRTILYVAHGWYHIAQAASSGRSQCLP